MNSVPLEGNGAVEYFSDDTIETVQQTVALAMNSHPDRLFILVQAALPKDYYSSDPRHWKNLFLRMSLDGETIALERMRTYLDEIRPGTGVTAKAWTREEWMDEPEEALFRPAADFTEWRILGVEEEQSWVLPTAPPQSLPIPVESRPLPRKSRLLDSLHPYPIRGFRAIEVRKDEAASILVNYFPYLTEGTPANIEPVRASLEGAREKFQSVLGLKAPKHTTVAILQAKWYIPWVNTQFQRRTSRTRFEQIFYGLTLSEDTPHVAFYTGKTDVVRHKFHVQDPKKKEPLLSPARVKIWYSTSQPQRQIPTLLLYRPHGKSDAEYDRISITHYDMTVSAVRSGRSKAGLDKVREELDKWVRSLDAVMAFVQEQDLAETRWELSQMTAQAAYGKEARQFDTRRMGCLRSLFQENQGRFALLRADTTLTQQEFQAHVLLRDAEPVPADPAAFLATEMDLAPEVAEDLARRVTEVGQIRERDIREFPVVEFEPKSAIIRFVTNLERTLAYVDILRYVLTENTEELNRVCPLRVEEVPAAAVVPVAVPEEQAPAAPAAPPKSKKKAALLEGFEGGAKGVTVGEGATPKYNYFNNRVQVFDAPLFTPEYPKACEHTRQVVVLSSDDLERIRSGEGLSRFSYEGVPANERMVLPLEGREGPAGIAICPPYWCVRDEIPLLEDQLVRGGAGGGELQCPVCGGLVREKGDEPPATHTVIPREKAYKYPGLREYKGNKLPCCYTKPQMVLRPEAVARVEEDDTYVLSDRVLPPRRIGYITEDMADRLGVVLKYKDTLVASRLASNKQDVFRVGLGRPSQTLPLMLDGERIVPPKDAVDKVKECSFYSTWSALGEGGTEEERILNGINTAFESGTMPFLDEVEYSTRFLRCSVMRYNSQTNELVCGFWSDVLRPDTRTILLVDNDILALVLRQPPKDGLKFKYTVDLRELPFRAGALEKLRTEYAQACASNLPSLDDAIQELRTQGKMSYEVILDPLGRAQALLVPGQVILPFRPLAYTPLPGVRVRNHYGDVTNEDLPSGASQRTFLEAAKNPGFKVAEPLLNTTGQVVELLLASGFRVPIVPEAGAPGPAKEVLETIRKDTETSLVSGEPNREDVRKAQEIAYSAEAADFLLFSLSKDIGEGGPEKYRPLREAIQSKSNELRAMLSEWMDAQTHWDRSASPVEFISKVRTPCGQFTRKDACNKSSLCGWHENKCKIRVKPVVDKRIILNRITKTLLENDKQRALVLDDRMSPFFSTILYLELPNEWFTTSL